MIWTAASESLLNKLQVLQKKAVRIVNKSALRAHTDPLFNKFQLLKLKQIRHFQVVCVQIHSWFITRWIQGLILYTV